MSNTAKSSPQEPKYARKKIYKNLLKKKIISEFPNDSLTNYLNPFSQQLTPWNQGVYKLQTSTNLLKQQAESKNFTHAQSIQITPESNILKEAENYSSLAWTFQIQQKKKSERYACPRLKICSQQIIVSKKKKQQAKSLNLSKKSFIGNKKEKKIANLTIEWDEDIIYNPQKKYLQEQSLKRKILREFAQSKNQNRHLNSRRQLKDQDKKIKIFLKNNKLHKKQLLSSQFKQTKCKNDQANLESLQVQTQQKNQKLKVKNLSFQPIQHLNNSTELFKFDQQKKSSPQKWRFRTSFKSKRHSFTQKINNKNLTKNQSDEKTQSFQSHKKKNNQPPILNRITIGISQKIFDCQAPLQLISKTTPHFFKKTID